MRLIPVLKAMNMPLTANDLCIRPFLEADVPAFVGAVRESVDTVGAWMPWCHAGYSDAEARSWFEQCLANFDAASAYDLGIFTSDGGTLLGGVSINQINIQHGFGNVGYWVRQSRQRQRVATRAVQLIGRYGFSSLKLTRLEIVVVVDNLASRGVAEKVGAVYECIARNRLVVDGKPMHAVVYSITPGRRALTGSPTINGTLALFTAMAVLAAVPSTSVLVVSARSASSGFRHGALTAAGIVLGDIVFILLAVFGLALLVEVMGPAFVLVKYAGGAYLLWLGAMIWRSRHQRASCETDPALHLCPAS